MFENSYYEFVALAELLLQSHETEFNNRTNTIDNSDVYLIKSVDSITNTRNANKNFVKLPTISLPKFTGNSENWLEFREIIIIDS